MNTPATATPSRHQGQGMTEYIVIVALIAVYQFFDQTIRSQTAGIAQEVSDQTASTVLGRVQPTAPPPKALRAKV
jgi:hypothetical protein